MSDGDNYKFVISSCLNVSVHLNLFIINLMFVVFFNKNQFRRHRLAHND